MSPPIIHLHREVDVTRSGWFRGFALGLFLGVMLVLLSLGLSGCQEAVAPCIVADSLYYPTGKLAAVIVHSCNIRIHIPSGMERHR